jgi:ABC-2 type transport system permease protein
MAIHSIGYQHWDGQRRSIWHRRQVIAAQGLRACLRGRWLKRLIVVSWSAALAQVAVLFFLGQLLVTDSLIVRGLGNLDPHLRTIAQGLMAWLEMHPEVSVGATQNFLFYYFSRFYLPLTMLSLALAIPHLISRDLAGNAMVVYASKAVNRTDYLLGKLGTCLGLLTLTWLGPVCVVWLIGNLLAPQWHFFWHSRGAIGHAVAFVTISMLILSGLALGASALSGREKLPVGAWIAFWLVGGFISRGPGRHGVANPAQSWLENVSITFNLDQIAAALFRLPNDLKLAQDNIPFFANLTRNISPDTLATLNHPDLTGATVVLGSLLIAAAILVSQRIKPE